MTVETSMTVAAFGHVINGTCESPPGRLSVLVDPVTDNVYARAAVGSADDVDRACRSSEKAARSWRRSTPARRQELLLALADALEANAKYFLEVECRSTGKPLRQVRDDEIPQCVDFLRYFAGIARSLPGVAAMEYTEGATSYVRREPIGVIGVDRSLELPVDDGGLEDRAGTRDGKHPRAQAGRGDAGNRGDAGSACSADLSARGVERSVRRSRYRSRARRSSGSSDDCADGIDESGYFGRKGRVGRRQAVASRTRRQGTRRCFRRRGPRRRSRGDCCRGLLQQRSRLHRCDEDSRSRGGCGGVHREVDGCGRGLEVGRTGIGRLSRPPGQPRSP